MSTRKAKDDAFLRQGKFASSPEFERGLIGNLVAKRAALLRRPEDRELIWSIHFLSHQEGGLAWLAEELIARYQQHIGTRTMLATSKSAGQNFTAEEIRSIRHELPENLRRKFPLKGETPNYLNRLSLSAANSRALIAANRDYFTYEEIMTDERERIKSEAAQNPVCYPVATLRKLCVRAAQDGIEGHEDQATPNLERCLAEMCLDPKLNPATDVPWYFAGLIDALRDFIKQWTVEKTNWPETKLGRIIAEEFDYTWHGRCMSLLSGEARRGKSFAARNHCFKNIGRARFVEVPPGNDDTSFFRALARGLGLGNLLRYKTIDIRERVESVLLPGNLILVLDEAHRLWPERNFRYAFPSRITWLMAMANAKVPILLISTPQFMHGQKVAEKTGWNSAQLTGRIFNYKHLPADLDDADLMAVCKAILPEASEQVLRVLSTYARTSARYLAAVESIAMRARYLAGLAGRDECSTADVRLAMKESVIPSDTALNAALELSCPKTNHKQMSDPVPAEPEQTVSSRNRSATPANPSEVVLRRSNITEFQTA